MKIKNKIWLFIILILVTIFSLISTKYKEQLNKMDGSWAILILLLFMVFFYFQRNKNRVYVTIKKIFQSRNSLSILFSSSIIIFLSFVMFYQIYLFKPVFLVWHIIIFVAVFCMVGFIVELMNFLRNNGKENQEFNEKRYMFYSSAFFVAIFLSFLSSVRFYYGNISLTKDDYTYLFYNGKEYAKFENNEIIESEYPGREIQIEFVKDKNSYLVCNVGICKKFKTK